VKHWFEFPKENANVPVLESLKIDQHISSLWIHLLRSPDSGDQVSTLIPLPYSYIVPGGRFREIYYWDSYFTMLGLRIDGREDVINDMINNFSWLIAHFGHIPNGNRSYFLSRSQPPFFALMIELLAEIRGPEVYSQFLQDLLREYAFWMDDDTSEEIAYRRIVKLGEHQYLNRYYDDSNSPRAESYFEDRVLFEEVPDRTKRFFRT
jgi:alpha,alpha-trehalase